MRPQRVVHALLLCLFGCGDDEEPGRIEEPFAEAQAGIESDLAELGAPGASFAVAWGDELREVGLGLRRSDAADPVTPETRFLSASVVKMITAAAVSSAVDEGLLDLDAPVIDAVHLSFADGADGGGLTLHHLLSHTSGLPDFNPYTMPLEYEDCPDEPAELGEWFRTHALPLLQPPGTLWLYSNANFGIAGLALEAVDGVTYRDAMQARVFGRLHMDRSSFDPAAVSQDDYANPHALEADGAASPLPVDGQYCAPLAPAGNLYTTAGDLARFGRALVRSGEPILSAEAAARMVTPHAHLPYLPTGWPEQGYGYGLNVLEYKGHPLWMHSGSLAGTSTCVAMVPDAELVVAVMFNEDRIDACRRALDAADVFLGTADLAPPDTAGDPATWGDLLGRYEDPLLFGVVEVTLDGDRLVARLESVGVDLPLTPQSGDLFTTQFDGLDVEVWFVREPGEPARFVGTRAAVFARVD